MHSQAHLLRLCVITLFCLSLIACGGSQNNFTPEPLKDNTPPYIASILPDDDTFNNFEVDYQVELQFSELMNTNSLIEEGGVSLFSGFRDPESDVEDVELEPRESLITLSIVPVEGTDLVTNLPIQVPATKVQLTHSSGRFALNNRYTVIVDHPARDLIEDDVSTQDIDERNFISGETSIDFTTEKGEWKSVKYVPNITVDSSSGTDKPLSKEFNQYSPQIVANKNGDTYVIWREEITPSINELWISRYSVNDKKWTLLDVNQQVCENSKCANAMKVSSQNSTSVLEYDISINNAGQIAVVWTQANEISGFNSVWANLYDGVAWLGVTDISDTGFTRTGNADSPQVGIDEKGNVVSIWREHENSNTTSRIKANIFRIESGSAMSSGLWIEAPSYINSSSQVLSRSPKLSMSSSGLAIAVWAEKGSDYFHINSNHLRLYQQNDWDWIGSERIDFNTELGQGHSSLPDIAIDYNNDAMAIWLKHDGQRNNLWYSRFVGSWGAADYVERDRLGDAAFPVIAFSRDNRALVAWTQENKQTNTKNLVANFFDVNLTNGWGSQKEIASSDVLVKPIASFDREGNVALIWQDGLTKGAINTSYYSKLTSIWETPETLSSSGNDASLSALLEDGRFLAVWEAEESSDFRIESALFSD